MTEPPPSPQLEQRPEGPGVDPKLRAATPERVDPARMGGRIIHAEHVARYAWATPLIADREVLDAGCGLGYGAQMLVDAGARRVVGVDVSSAAIAQAGNSAPEVEFLAADLEALPFPNASFDVVVCFEVLEHLLRPRDALREVQRVLRPDGVLVLSTPNSGVQSPRNEHHVEEFTADRLERLLLDVFAGCRLERQHLWAATLIGPDELVAITDPALAIGASVRKLASRAPGEETFTIAVAGDGALPATDPLAMLQDTYEVALWQERLNELRGETLSARQELEASRARELRSASQRKQISAALEELSRDSAELRSTRAILDQTRAILAQTREELEGTRLALGSAEQELHHARAAERWLEIIQDSASWRITRPLRAATRLTRRLIRRRDPSSARAPR